MENKEDFEERRKNESLPQYGKKGHKPRVKRERSEVCMDNLHTNLIEYWNKASTFSSVTKFSWATILGVPKKVWHMFQDAEIMNNTQVLNPSQVMTIDVTVGPGWAENTGDGVNRGLSQTMSKIRAALSTSNIGFETADLGIFFSSTSSIAAMIGYVKRLLELRLQWRDRNYAYPRGLIQALGQDWDDIMNHINEYIARLNAAIDQYNQMGLLDAFDLYGREYAMFHSVFMDEDSEYGQMYMFSLNNYYLYSDTSEPSQAISTLFDKTSFSTMMECIEKAIAAWLGSSDFYQINGTLLRAFKEAPRQRIPNITLTDTVEPVVDRDFLMQIMNMSVIPGTLTNLNITQDPTQQNFIVWTPKTGVLATGEWPYVAAGGTECVWRLFENDVTPEDNMELTRLWNFYNPSTGFLEGCGSEIVTGFYLWQYDTEQNISSSQHFISNTLLSNSTSFISRIAALSPFRYIPPIHLVRPQTGSGETTVPAQYFGMLGDQYNWMVYSKNDWLELQKSAYQSIWMTDL